MHNINWFIIEINKRHLQLLLWYHDVQRSINLCKIQKAYILYIYQFCGIQVSKKWVNLYMNMILHKTSNGNKLSIPYAELPDNYMSCKNIKTTAE